MPLNPRSFEIVSAAAVTEPVSCSLLYFNWWAVNTDENHSVSADILNGITGAKPAPFARGPRELTPLSDKPATLQSVMGGGAVLVICQRPLQHYGFYPN